jgi:hypothetical protein
MNSIHVRPCFAWKMELKGSHHQAGAQMAISLVQTKAATSISATTVSFSSGTTAGSCVIAVTNAEVTALTLGGTSGLFTQLATVGSSSSSQSAAIWAAPNVTTGNLGVGETGGAVWYIYEVSGVAASSVLDKSSTTTGNGITTWTSGATATTTQASEFWVGAICHGNGGTGSLSLTGPSSPWTNLAQVPTGTATLVALSGYQVASSAGTATYSGTAGGGSGDTGNSYAAVVTLLPAATVATRHPKWMQIWSPLCGDDEDDSGFYGSFIL